MNKCQRFENMFPEAYYGELTDHKMEEFDQHLQECSKCAAEYERMQSALNIMDKREQPELAEAEWQAAQENLFAKLNYDPNITENVIDKIKLFFKPISEFQYLPTVRLAGAALLIVFGIFLGRIYFPQPAPVEFVQKENNSFQVQNAAAVDQAHHYLQKSKVLLLGISNLDVSQESEFIPNLSQQKQMSRALIEDAAVLKDNLNSPPDQRLRQLISELEVILLQIANLENNHDLREVELIQRGVEQKALLFKIVIEEMDKSETEKKPKNEKQKI